MDNNLEWKRFGLYGLLLSSGVAYYLLAYGIQRQQFIPLMFLFIILFIAYSITYHLFSKTQFRKLVMAGMVFRVLLIFSIPNLSDDVYRFIWDGRLSASGINPFAYLPSEIMQLAPVKGISQSLFDQLNSPHYYTIYPPVLQGIFWITAQLFPENNTGAILFLKSFLVLIDAGTFFIMIQLLKKLSLPKPLSLLYWLNPLVLVELTGNAHPEGVMLFFLLGAFLLFYTNRWMGAACLLGTGIATKLVPVLFLPLLFFQMKWKKAVLFCALSGITTLILFALVFDLATTQHLLKSVNLFMGRFEFNASLYYIVRGIGMWVKGYNIIATAAPVLSLVAAVGILFISVWNRKENASTLSSKALLIISTWYLFSTTVHPWYICLPVALSVFTPYRFALIWSFTAVLSYAAYQTSPVQEKLWLTGVGYVLVLGYGIWELMKQRKHSSTTSFNQGTI